MQVDHYTSYISSNPEWELVEVYADDGISATNTAKRESFNRMIADCRAGKIDMILTKSISRFSRNTVDCLKYTRELKMLNIAVFFDKDYIKKRSYPVYGRFSFNKPQYLVISRCILTLHFVVCRLVVA